MYHTSYVACFLICSQRNFEPRGHSSFTHTFLYNQLLFTPMIPRVRKGLVGKDLQAEALLNDRKTVPRVLRNAQSTLR